MANTPLTLNHGRQYPLVVSQSFTFANVADAGVAASIAKLPRGAVILDAKLVITAGFGAGSTLAFGTPTSGAAYGTIDVSAPAVKPLTITGVASDQTTLTATPNAALTAGAATLYLTYVVGGRANEAQP